MLYQLSYVSRQLLINGAGDGDRTHAIGLERAEVLPLNYTRPDAAARSSNPDTDPEPETCPATTPGLSGSTHFPVVVGKGFEPSKA